MPYKNPEQQRKYGREWIRSRRETWLRNNGPCCLCGSQDDLQVDHIDPDQKISHRIWSWSEEKRNAELIKCQVLCKVCHKKKTSTQLSAMTRHGTTTMYHKYKCRCDLCKVAKQTHNARRKQKKA